MKEKSKKSWILWLYIAVLCCFIGIGVVYCAGMVKSEAGASVEYAEGNDIIDLEDIEVPVGDAN